MQSAQEAREVEAPGAQVMSEPGVKKDILAKRVKGLKQLGAIFVVSVPPAVLSKIYLHSEQPRLSACRAAPWLALILFMPL